MTALATTGSKDIWVEAESFEQLKEKLEAATKEQYEAQIQGNTEKTVAAEAKIQDCIGYLALMLNNAIRQQDAELLHSILREMGLAVDTGNARWLLSLVRKDLPPELDEWMMSAIASIRSTAKTDD